MPCQEEPRSGSTMRNRLVERSGTCGSHQLKKWRASKRSNMDSFASHAFAVGPLRGPWLAHHIYRRFRYRSTRRLGMIMHRLDHLVSNSHHLYQDEQ
jgi:hypothetical protein